VVVWHDAASDTVRIAYANSAAPANAQAWTRKTLLASTDTYYTGSGAYVSIIVDRKNTDAAKKDMVHLAFYNSTHDTVVYAYGKVGSAFTAEAVDMGFNGGAWTDITLDESGNPWITYQDANRVNNTDGARMAYKNTALYGANGGGWEAMTVPTVGDTAGTGYNVADGRLNIEAWPPGNKVLPNYGGITEPFWSAAVGYQSDKFRIAYYLKPTAF
jgi:hypothetical protein